MIVYVIVKEKRGQMPLANIPRDSKALLNETGITPEYVNIKLSSD